MGAELHARREQCAVERGALHRPHDRVYLKAFNDWLYGSSASILYFPSFP